MAKGAESLNKRHFISNFAEVEAVSLKNHTEVDGDINDKEYIDKENFRQILTLKLKNPGRD